jgi:hypothetical protein
MGERAMCEGAVKKAEMVKELTGEINIVESLVSIFRRRHPLNAIVRKSAVLHNEPPQYNQRFVHLNTKTYLKPRQSKPPVP